MIGELGSKKVNWRKAAGRVLTALAALVFACGFFKLNLNAASWENNDVLVQFDLGEYGSFTDGSDGYVRIAPTTGIYASFTDYYNKYLITMPAVETVKGIQFDGWKLDEVTTVDENCVVLVDDPNRVITTNQDYFARNDKSFSASDSIYLSILNSVVTEIDISVPVITFKAQYSTDYNYSEPVSVPIPFYCGEHGHFTNDSTSECITVNAVGEQHAKYTRLELELPEITPNEGYLFAEFKNTLKDEKFPFLLNYSYSAVSDIDNCTELNEFKVSSYEAVYYPQISRAFVFDAGEYGTVNGQRTSTLSVDASEVLAMYGYDNPEYQYYLSFPEVTNTTSTHRFIGWKYIVPDPTCEHEVDGCDPYDIYYSGTNVRMDIKRRDMDFIPYIMFVALYEDTYSSDDGDDNPDWDPKEDGYSLTVHFIETGIGIENNTWIAKESEKEKTYISKVTKTEDVDGEDITVAVFNIYSPTPDYEAMPRVHSDEYLMFWQFYIGSNPAQNPVTNRDSMYADDTNSVEIHIPVSKFGDNGKFDMNIYPVGEDKYTRNINYTATSGQSYIVSGSSKIYSFADQASYLMIANIGNTYYTVDIFKALMPNAEREFGYKILGWKADVSTTQTTLNVGGYLDMNGNMLSKDTYLTPGTAYLGWNDGGYFGGANFSLATKRIPTIGITFSNSPTTNMLESVDPSNGKYNFSYTLPDAPVEKTSGAISACWTYASTPANVTVTDGSSTITSGYEVDEGTKISISVDEAYGDANPNLPNISFVIMQDNDTVRKSDTITMTTSMKYDIKPGTWHIGGDGIEYTVTGNPDFYVTSNGDYTFEKLN